MTFDVPKGWTLTTLTKLAGIGGLVADGDWVESKDQDPNGDVRLIQLADIGDGQFHDRSARFLTSQKARELRCTMIEAGDVLIARMPDPLGRACIFPGVGQPSVTAVDVFIWRAGKNAAEPRWLMHAINSPQIREHLQNIAGGTTRQRVSGGNLKRLALPTPPKAMQLRIAAQLDGLLERSESARDELTHIPKLVERYRQACIQQIFNDLDAEERPLGELIALGPQNGLYLPKSSYGAGIPILRIDNFALDDKVDRIADWKRVQLPVGQEGKYDLIPNDIVINRVNSPTHLGKSMVVRPAHVPAVFESNMMRFSVTDAILPTYLQIFLSCDHGRRRLTKNAKWAVNQASINQTDVCNTEIPLPGLIVQKNIIEKVVGIKQWTSAILNSAIRGKELSVRLDKAVLAKAFGGELVVPHSAATAETMVAAE